MEMKMDFQQAKIMKEMSSFFEEWPLEQALAALVFVLMKSSMKKVQTDDSFEASQGVAQRVKQIFDQAWQKYIIDEELQSDIFTTSAESLRL